MSEIYTPLTMEQIEKAVEEVIESNAVWPDPLPSQVTAVMDVLREAMAQAWDEGWEHSVHPKDHNPYWPTDEATR